MLFIMITWQYFCTVFQDAEMYSVEDSDSDSTSSPRYVIGLYSLLYNDKLYVIVA